MGTFDEIEVAMIAIHETIAIDYCIDILIITAEKCSQGG